MRIHLLPIPLPALVLSLGFVAILQAAEPNALTAQEKKDHWQLLFDGRTMNHWIDPAGFLGSGTGLPISLVIRRGPTLGGDHPGS